MSSSSVEQCALCADSMHDVHHAIVEVNVVIGVLVVHCELLVVRVVPIVGCDDAVVRRTLVLIALHRSHCFRRSHFIEFCCMGDILFTDLEGIQILRNHALRGVITLRTPPTRRWTLWTTPTSSQVMSPTPTTSRRLTSRPTQSP